MVATGPDGLNLGLLVMNWGNLSLLLGLLTWFWLARFASAQAVALVTLAAARLWATLPGWTASRPLLDNLWDVLDVRRGGWAWGPGLLAGLLYQLWLAWKGRVRLPAALRAAAPAVVVSLLPLLLRPAPAPVQLPPLSFRQLDGEAVTLPRPGLINLWASWCGPCRSEMPLLLREAAHDPRLVLLNVGEDAGTVRRFLGAAPAQVWLGGEALTGPARVTGFPTTLVMSASGQVIARHLGPLTRADLLKLHSQLVKELP